MKNWIEKEIISKYTNSVVATWLAQVSCFQFCGVLLALIGWCMGITSTASTQWRVWYIENVPGISSKHIWIGIWKVCFLQNDMSEEDNYLHCEDFTEEYRTLPKEIFVAQDLMSLAAILQSLAIGSMVFALWNVFKGTKHRQALLTFLTIGGILSLISGIIILVPISLNLYSVLMKSSIDFPELFALPSSPTEQYVGYAIYEGYVASAFLIFSGILILSEKCRRKSRKINPLILAEVHLPPTSSKTDSQNCPKCSSSTDLTKPSV